jgi:predicted regulator of Ras-like GTPase activity (Roadblock/LC7/MglB family)
VNRRDSRSIRGSLRFSVGALMQAVAAEVAAKAPAVQAAFQGGTLDQVAVRANCVLRTLLNP